MKRLLVAVRFLTILPAGKGALPAKEEISASMALFPAVGFIQGMILAVLNFLLSPALPEPVVAGILVLALALTNGGFHLDGFCDTVDGLAGGKTPEERLKIMRDSSTGAVAAVFAFMLLLLKFLSIQELPLEAKAPALLVFPVIGRWAMVPLSYFAPYARKEGLGAAFSGTSRGALYKASAFAAAISVLAIGIFSVLLMLVSGAVVYALAAFFKKRLGGITGDVYGFTSEVSEVIFLIMVLALSGVLSADV